MLNVKTEYSSQNKKQDAVCRCNCEVSLFLSQKIFDKSKTCLKLCHISVYLYKMLVNNVKIL